MSANAATTADPLTTVQQFLDTGRAHEAIAYLRKVGAGTLELSNALAVAHMRAGEPTKAVEIYRRLCVDSSGFVLKPNLPVLLKANYATALLLARNAAGCRALLKEITRSPEPYAPPARRRRRALAPHDGLVAAGDVLPLRQRASATHCARLPARRPARQPRRTSRRVRPLPAPPPIIAAARA